jgi:hypothetical protein
MGVFDEGLTNLTEHLSFEKILSGDFSGVISLFYIAVLIAIYSVAIYHFYRYIARRDCFKPINREHTKTLGFFKYFCLFPVIAVIFFLGFSMMLLFMAKEISLDLVLSTSFAIVIAIRICSYYSEDLSRDVAKMLPFALLGIFLVSPSYFVFEDIINKFNSLPELINIATRYILFIVIVEWILRAMLTIRCSIFPSRGEAVPEEAE